MPSTRSSSRKRQMTLNLTPVASSSPTEASAHIGTRLAAVRYGESPRPFQDPSVIVDMKRSRNKSRQTILRSGYRLGVKGERRDGLHALSSPAGGHGMKTGLQSPDPSSQPHQPDKECRTSPITDFPTSSESSNSVTPVVSSKVTATLSGKTKATVPKAIGSSKIDGMQATESDSDLEIKTPTRRRFSSTSQARSPDYSSKSRLQSSDQSPQTSSEESVLVSPAKRRRLTRLAKSRDRSNTWEQPLDEIAEDVEDLKGTELQDYRIRARPIENKQSKAMELLRQRRANKGVSNSVFINHDSDHLSDQSEKSKDFISVADVGTCELDVRQTMRENLDVSDDEFVTSDEEAPLGAPSALADMPLEYTRHSHKPLKDHFKDAVEWLVHKKLNPAFPRSDPIYRIAFSRLDDEVKGYSGSKFISSAWAGDFARSLKARPEFVCSPTGKALFEQKCDACNRSGHPPTWRILFPGKVYDKETLEDIADDSEDEDVRDSRGNYVPIAEKQYLVGRFCKSNAEMAHALLHWRHALNSWVLDWLSAESHTIPAKIIQREGWSTRKRGEYANRVVDSMEDTGQIRALWRDWKIILDQARMKPARFGKGEE